MDIYEAWENALKNTEVIRTRVQSLKTFHETLVPYIFLAESQVNLGDTVVRRGQVRVERPSLVLPPNNPQIEGFELEKDFGEKDGDFLNFLLVRGISLPSMRYDNKTHSLGIFEGKLSQAIKHFDRQLQQTENVSTGLITGPEASWQFSLLIFVCSQISRNIDTDIQRLIDEYKKNKNQ